MDGDAATDEGEEQETILQDGYEACQDQESLVASHLGVRQPCSPNLKSGLTDDLAKLSLRSPKVETTVEDKPKAKIETWTKDEIMVIDESPVQDVKKEQIEAERKRKMQRLEHLKQLSCSSLGRCLILQVPQTNEAGASSTPVRKAMRPTASREFVPPPRQHGDAGH